MFISFDYLMRIVSLIFPFIPLLLSHFAEAQVNGVGHCGAVLTNYTNGATNDSVFYWPTGQMGTLLATPPSGTGPWDFLWQSFSAGINSWVNLTTVNDQSSSTQANLAVGGYRVAITDANGVVVGSFRAWVGQVNPGTIQATHSATCTTVNLSAVVNGGTLTGYYNPPPDPFPLSASSQISVCFSANHTYVSDLGFYLVGPPSCGSPVVTLAPNPGSIGMGPICNSGNNVSNLCFSNSASANFNVCTAGVPLTGNFSSYGNTQTAINWSPVYGCDVTSPGWAVQIYDCIGLDVGSLTDATLTISGLNSLGVSQSVSYTTPAGFSSAINDNSCSAASASIFVVPVPQAQALSFTCGYLWTADPFVVIPNANQLNTSLPAPSVPTEFTLEVVCGAGGQPLNGYINCQGGNSSPTTFYTPVPWVTPTLSGPAELCQGEVGTFTSSVAGGTWSGPGVTPGGSFASGPGNFTLTFTPSVICTNPATINVQVNPIQDVTESLSLDPYCSTGPPQLIGNFPDISGPGITQQQDGTYFNPSAVPLGVYPYTSVTTDLCGNQTTLFELEVFLTPDLIINQINPICETSAPIILSSPAAGGTWSGSGIADALSGSFDPALAGPGTWDIHYVTSGNCPSSGSTQVVVEAFPDLIMTDPGLLCSNGSAIQLIANPAGGTWSGPGVSPSGTFNPSLAGGLQPSLTYEFSEACVASEDFVLDILPAPQPDAGPDVQICEGEEAVLEVGIGFDQVIWSPGGAGASIAVSTSGTYTATVTLDGCSETDQVVVTVIDMPVIDLGDDLTICEGEEVLIEAPYSGIWSTGDTGFSTSAGTPGIVSFVFPNSGCPVSDEVEVFVFQNYTFDLGPDVTLCPGDSVVLSAGGYLATWSNGSQATSFETSQEGLVTAQVTNGPCLTTDQVMVELLPLPIADLGPDRSLCLGQDIQLDASHPFNADYLWADGRTTSGLADPTVIPGTFLYSVQVSNACGLAVDEVVVTVADCEPAFFIPNAFTPDDDGINDAWRPVVRNVLEYEILVFNRWGDVVFSSVNPDEYWIGNMRDGEHFVPKGVYFYRLKYSTEKLDAGYIEGHVLVIR